MLWWCPITQPTPTLLLHGVTARDVDLLQVNFPALCLIMNEGYSGWPR